jgi:hypothetical protein
LADQLPPLVNADFNGLFTDRALNLEVAGVHWDLARLNLKLAEGMRLRAYDLDAEDGVPDNLIAGGTAHRWTETSGRPHWVLVLDYFGHESDFRNVTDHWANHTDWKEEQEVRERWRREHVGLSGGYYAAHKSFDE